MEQTTKSIVLVDDNRYVNIQFNSILKKIDREIEYKYFQTAADSKKCLDVHKPSILFMDSLLPDIDGFTFIEYLRRHELHQSTSIIMISATDYMQNRRIAIELNVQEFLIKPVPSDKLTEVIEKYINLEEE